MPTNLEPAGNASNTPSPCSMLAGSLLLTMSNEALIKRYRNLIAETEEEIADHQNDIRYLNNEVVKLRLKIIELEQQRCKNQIQTN